MQVEFGEFVRRVYGAPGGTKPVFADQCSFLGDGIGAAGVGRILRFERLHEDFVALAEELGIEGELPWRNASAAPCRHDAEPDGRSQRRIVCSVVHAWVDAIPPETKIPRDHIA